MHSVQAKEVIRLPFAQACRIDLAATYRAVTALFAAMPVVLRRLPRPTAHVVPNYEGHAWCDSMEHQVIADIVTCRRVGF
jgi:hypothetical protein